MSHIVTTLYGVTTNLQSNANSASINHALGINPGNLFTTGDTVTSLSGAGPATLTAAQLLGGVIAVNPSGAYTLNLPTPASIVAAISGAQVGMNFRVVVSNATASGGAITVVANGLTTVFANSTTIAVGTNRVYVAHLNNVTLGSEAVVLY